MKNVYLVLFFLSFFALDSIGQDFYFISYTQEDCDGTIQLCVNPVGQEVQYFEWVIPGIDTPIWSETDTIDNCVIIYNLFPGTYNIQVQMYDWMGDLILHQGPNGNTTTFLTETFEIFENTLPIFISSNAQEFCPGNSTGGCEKVCENTTITYFAQDPTGVLLEYQWSVVGAESSTDLGGGQLEVNWGEAGSGQVSVFAVDWNGCETVGEICVEIIPSPEADFSTMPMATNHVLSICQGQEVFFTNQTTGGIYYEWSFGDGEFTTDANPEHTYDNPGTYEVQLIAKNECLCSDTTTLDIEVEASISPFIDCVGTICKLDTFTYNSDADCADFFWTVSPNGTVISGGSQSDNFIAVEWLSGPVGNIELSVANCTGSYCLAPAMVQIPIISGDAEIRGPENVCKGAIESYTIQDYNGTYYNWAVTSGLIISGQGTNEVIVEWNSPGTLPGMAQISVDYENCYFECSGSDVMDVRIVDEFLGIGPIEVCPDETANYSTVKISGSGQVMSNWSLKDDSNTEIWSSVNMGSVSIPFPSNTGMYMLVIEPVNPDDYCNDFVEKIIKVVSKPDAPLGITGELAICPGSSYQYEASSSYADSDFVWYVNNGGTMEEYKGNPIAITWASSGAYEINVVQKLLDQLPCESDPFTQVINAITNVALAGVDQVCDQEVHTYTADFIENAQYVWTISPDDMGTITGDPEKNEIDIQWTKAGNATLTVALCGINEVMNVEVHALPLPTVVAPFELCANVSEVITVTSAFADYKWYDDNQQLINSTPSPSLFPGTYELIVTDNEGCTGNTYFTIETLPIPNIRASTPDATGICLSSNDAFPELYALNSDVGYSWQWYKDGVIMIGETGPTLLVKALGSFHVEVVAANGCTNTSNIITVFDWCDPAGGGTCNGGNCNLSYCDNPGGTLDFSFAQGAQCNEWDFTNLSTNFEVGSLSWNFGDEAVGTDFSILENPSYIFSNAGFYHVLLIGRVLDLDNPGAYCDIWRSKVITVKAAAKFDLDTGCPGEITKFYDNSTFVPGEDIISWTWNFGDPASGIDNTSNDQDPTHVYNAVGNYTVSLEVATSTCVSIYTQEITVYPKPIIDIVQPDVFCANTAIEFEGTSVEHVVNWEWDFGDVASGDRNEAFVQVAYHAYDTPGTYNVTLTAYNVYGCTEVANLSIDIEPNNLNGDIISDNDNPMCDGETAILTAPSGGVSWEWSTGENTESISVTTANVYNVTVTDIEGCTYIPTEFIQLLHPRPNSTIRGVDLDQYGQALQYHYNGMSKCEGEDVYLEVIEVENYSYSWSSGQSSSQIEYSFDRDNLLAVGTHVFTLTLTDDITGCTNEIGPFEVIVHPVPTNITISSNPSGYLCGGDATDLTVNSPNANYTYIWNNGQTGTSINVSMAGEYYVVAINEFGCEGESNVIEVHKGPDIGLIPDGCFERCGPDTLCLPVIPNIVSYQWYFNDGIVPAPNGNDADFIIEQSGTYYVELEDSFGCVTTSEEFTITLVDPTGILNGAVYYDVNGNGIIDGPDTLMQDVQVYIENTSDGSIDSLITDVNGELEWLDIASVTYDLSVDVSSLPDGIKPYDATINVELLGCDDEEGFSFLCFTDCAVTGSTETLEFCSGSHIYEGVNFEQDTSFVLTYNNAAGCDSLVTVNATVYDPIVFSLVTNPICFNANDGIINVMSPTGGKGVLRYSIDGINFSTTQTFDNLASNNYTIYVQDDLSCMVQQSIQIDQFSELSSNVELEYCFGSNDYNGISISNDTSFVQVIQSVQGCDSTLYVNAVVYDEIQADLGSTSSCFNDSNGMVSINTLTGGKGNLTYSLEGTVYTTTDIKDLAAGTYTFEVTDELGCSISEEVIVDQIGAIQYSIEVPVLDCDEVNDQIVLNVTSPDVEVLWEDSSDQNEFEVDAIGNYTVELSNACETITEDIEVHAQELDTDAVYVPNVFSPNGDGANDVFQVFTAPTVEFLEADLVIHDRWGELLYETDDPKEPWNGVFSDRNLQPGVYVIMLKARLTYCHQELEYDMHSSLTIVK